MRPDAKRAEGLLSDRHFLPAWLPVRCAKAEQAAAEQNQGSRLGSWSRHPGGHFDEAVVLVGQASRFIGCLARVVAKRQGVDSGNDVETRNRHRPLDDRSRVRERDVDMEYGKSPGCSGDCSPAFFIWWRVRGRRLCKGTRGSDRFPRRGDASFGRDPRCRLRLGLSANCGGRFLTPCGPGQLRVGVPAFFAAGLVREEGADRLIDSAADRTGGFRRLVGLRSPLPIKPRQE